MAGPNFQVTATTKYENSLKDSIIEGYFRINTEATLKRMQIDKRAFFAVTFFTVMLISFSSGWAKDTVQAKITFKTDLTLAKTQNTFSAYDKVYALVTLSGLQPGSHRAVINWIDPTGAINQYKKIPFTIAKQNGYTFYSWLRLLKNGPMKSTISGRRFDDEYIGRWELHLFIDGVLLKKIAFTLHA